MISLTKNGCENFLRELSQFCTSTVMYIRSGIFPTCENIISVVYIVQIPEENYATKYHETEIRIHID